MCPGSNCRLLDMVSVAIYPPPRVVALRARRLEHRERRVAIQAVIDEEGEALAIQEEAEDNAIHWEELRHESEALRLQQALLEVRARRVWRPGFLVPPVLAGVLAIGGVGSLVYFSSNQVGAHYGAMLGLAIPTVLLMALCIAGPWVVLSLAPWLRRKRDEEVTLRQIAQLEDRKQALASDNFWFDWYEHPDGEEYCKVNYDVSAG